MKQIFFEKNPNINAHIATAASSLLMMLILGTVVYHRLEGWTWIQSLYFTVVTMATIGYGDLHPTSEISRLFTVFFILFGVSIGIVAISLIGTSYLSKREAILIQSRKSNKNKRGNKITQHKIEK